MNLRSCFLFVLSLAFIGLAIYAKADAWVTAMLAFCAGMCFADLFAS